MKIEKINDNQIRCIITKEDLRARHIELNELAYGTDNAKKLFREMMNFAQKKYGFEAEEFPLMIEAVPLPEGTLLLIITKVSYPDELDSRFAYFSDFDSDHNINHQPGKNGYRNDILSSNNFFSSQNASEIINICSDASVPTQLLIRHFTFKSLDDVVSAAKVVGSRLTSNNSLYKDKNGDYHLVLSIGNHSAYEFNKICNCLSEYGTMNEPGGTSVSLITEHAKLLLTPHALYDLARL